MTPREILNIGPVIPVISVAELDTAVDLAQALVAGGVRTLEITLRTPAALSAIERIVKAVPEAVVGAGTVINAEQLRAVADAGAQFAISPGLNVQFAEAVVQSSIPVIPGVATAGELMLALEYGLDMLKLFPAEAVGGRALLKSFHGPFPQVKFCPTGGINLAGASDYLALPNVLCVGGSWLAPQPVVAQRNWREITRLASEAAALR